MWENLGLKISGLEDVETLKLLKLQLWADWVNLALFGCVEVQPPWHMLDANGGAEG